MDEISSLDSYNLDDTDSLNKNDSETIKPNKQSSGSKKNNLVKTSIYSLGKKNDPNELDGGYLDEVEKEFRENLEDDESQTTSIQESINEEENQETKNYGNKKHTNINKNKDVDSEEFEEVDANVLSNPSIINLDESVEDMLGESDMTLPSKASDVTTEKSVEAMEVDDEDDVLGESATSVDVEMSTDFEDKYTTTSIDNIKEKSTLSLIQNDNETGQDVVDTSESIRLSKESVELNDNEDNYPDPDDEVDSFDVDKEEDEINETEQVDDEGEHEDEPVENVQEPEESDFCLIHDDTETQMTQEEKDQAILARENAEMDDSISNEKDRNDISEDQIETDKEGGNENRKGSENLEQMETELNAERSGSEENIQNADVNDGREIDDALADDMHGSNEETNVAQKTIITGIIGSKQFCKQCSKETLCKFRYKMGGQNGYEYICQQSCCDALMRVNSGKYFIRRKKFLVEELSGKNNANEQNDNVEISADDKLDDEEKSHVCLQCGEMNLCKYFLRQDDDCFYICSEDCFNELSNDDPEKFKLKRHSTRVRNICSTSVSSNLPRKSSESSIVTRTEAEMEEAKLDRTKSFIRRCANCSEDITLGDKNLVWEIMDFCDEVCLGKYQRSIGSNCQTCHGEVTAVALGKYCVRFGFDVRQFCCGLCLNEYKKGLKTCSCCQKDISSGTEGFLAPVGDKEQFKDFCSQTCLRRYDSMCNPKKKLRQSMCAVCKCDKPVRVEIILDDKEHSFCSNPCISAFKFVSNIIPDQCGMCRKYFERKSAESFTIYTERRTKLFCSRVCLNVYIIVNRTIVSCQWCKVKKYNFDMIYKQQDVQETLMCSLNCLTLYGVSLHAFTQKAAKCDNCNASSHSQYHLTMSDATIRNFCTYQCVMQFQNQFSRTPLAIDPTDESSHSKASTSPKGSAPFPTGLPKRVKVTSNSQNLKKISGKKLSREKSLAFLPAKSNISSSVSTENIIRKGRGRGRKMESPTPLAQSSTSTSTNTNATARGRRKNTGGRSPSPAAHSPPRTNSSKRGNSALNNSNNNNTITPVIDIKEEKNATPTNTKIITVPPLPPAVRNVQTNCKPQMSSIGTQYESQSQNVSCQTEKDYSNKILIPVPVPIYVPQPMYMYSAPFPVPVPIPLPIPVPIFIPTTRNSAQGILKEIKKIQDKMPSDPFEAELLMMAEMVADEKRESDSDSDDGVAPETEDIQIEYNNTEPQIEVVTNSYGEDVLQMALKMATGEYDQPTTEDLETAMTTNTIANPPSEIVVHEDTIEHMNPHQLQQEQTHQPIVDGQRSSGRGRKRNSLNSSGATRANNRSPIKRQRIPEMDSPSGQMFTAVQPVQPNEKPDINMCLKYTFGVNAWKQWVTSKNTDIEKSTVRRRIFKTELIQMTADELNFSLCLFVKEVRKPNGTEYAPDTIYYLVLGIQQYLYENGRIDNIFTDTYYERFTDCLDEVARRFSVLYNDSQYIVTRVEEEHLWECKQLGAHSPHVLLSTLMFFNTKHFNLTTVDEHMQLSFSHIMKHWKRSVQSAKVPGTRNVLLRFYPPQAGLDANPRKKKVYEQQENEENPLRCPVRLYEFYLSKCPESVKTRNDVFYLQPERSCVPDSPVWYSTQPLSQDSLQKMLHRVKMVKEINIALLTS